MLFLENGFLLLRDPENKKIGAQVFGEILNVVLEENEEDKVLRESNQLSSLRTTTRDDKAKKQYPAYNSPVDWTYSKKKLFSSRCN